MSSIESIQEVVKRLKASTEEQAQEIVVSRDDLDRLLTFVEKGMAVAENAHTLLTHSYSMPDDDRGIRFLSEDAVKLQWALREIGIGDDSGQPCFTI